MTETANNDVKRFKKLNEEEWTNTTVVNGWRKWHEPCRTFFRPLTEKMIGAGNLQPRMRVLDMASGSGEPAITFAGLVGPEGHVTATDFGADMLATAEENANKVGLKNITFQQADALSLPYADESFDRVTCRQGIMYFGDYVHALQEIRRVLKANSLVVLTTTGSFEQPFFQCLVGTLMKHVKMPPPEPNAPNPFYFGTEGLLTNAFKEAGFNKIHEEHLSPELFWPGSPNNLWQWFLDVAAPFKPLLEQLSANQYDQVYQEICREL